MPDGEVRGDEDERDHEQDSKAAHHRHVEQEPRREQDQPHLHVADQDVGDDLAEHHLERARRHGEQVLHRAALALARDGQRGDHHHRHRQHDAHQARHDVVLRDRLGVVVRVDAQLDGPSLAARKRERPFEVVARGPSTRARAASRCALLVAAGIGGVGLDEDRGPLAAQQIAREILGNVDDELHFAAREQRRAPSASVVSLRDECEVAAVPDGVQQRAAVRAVVGHEHGGRQMLRVGVDGEAEEHELHQRHADHHAEGERGRGASGRIPSRTMAQKPRQRKSARACS